MLVCEIKKEWILKYTLKNKYNGMGISLISQNLGPLLYIALMRCIKKRITDVFSHSLNYIIFLATVPFKSVMGRIQNE